MNNLLFVWYINIKKKYNLISLWKKKYYFKPWLLFSYSKSTHLRNTIKELQTEYSLFESIIEDVEQNQKQDSRENQTDIKNAIKDIKEEMIELEEKVANDVTKIASTTLTDI